MLLPSDAHLLTIAWLVVVAFADGAPPHGKKGFGVVPERSRKHAEHEADADGDPVDDGQCHDMCPLCS